MVKVRMNTADVAAEVKCLRRLIGMGCSNVYDLSPKTYVFKMMNSSGITESGESEKVLLLMESGVRLHTIAYLRDKSKTPSGFTLKLRKHIRTRRLKDVRQLGYDPIILFQFGVGANAYYIILELHAQGNILLTDSDFMVLTLLRSHWDDDKGLAIMARHRYPVESCRVFERTDRAKLQAILTSFNDHQRNEHVEDGAGGNKIRDAPERKKGNRKAVKSNDSSKKKDTKQATLKVVLEEALGYGPALSEHIILDAGLTPNWKVPKNLKLEDSSIQALSEGVKRFEDWLEDVISGAKIPEGYILMQQKKIGKDQIPVESSSTEQIYDEFCPLLLNQFNSRVFQTFDAALDEYYSKIESLRAEQHQQAKESSAMHKLSKIRNDQENRVQLLNKEVDWAVIMAKLIEYNLGDVDAAILSVRVALAYGMSWHDLTRMVKEEKKSGNPIAGLIDKLHLERNSMTLLLSNNFDEMDDDEITQPVEKVEVDLSLSAHANAQRLHEQKKKHESKQEKTLTAHAKPVKAAEKKTHQQLSQEKFVAAISHIRKVHWFEKFNWFISSENYLVISGRDAQQSEMIVKCYMSKGDLYVHAEPDGASSTVIKNHQPDNPVPPLTLNQAGSFTVCHSQAWNSKIVSSAWWVYPHQVSKTAPTGEYLTVGSFMIRGKKNFLPPHPLVMGFGMLFCLDESSLGSHLNERRVRGEENGVNESEDTEPFEELSDSGSEAEDPVNIPDVSTNNQTLAISNHEIRSSDINATNLRETSVEEEEASHSGNAATVSPELEDLLDRAVELGAGAKKYGHHASQPESDNVNNNNNNNNKEKKETVREKLYISEAERRKLKKGQTHDGTGHGKEHVEEKNEVENQPQKDVQNLKLEGGGKVSCRQKRRPKKMNQEYADQDEEERKIRMALLASEERTKGKEQEVQSEAITASKESKSVGGNEDAPKRCYNCEKVVHLTKDCQEQHLDTNGRPEDNDTLNETERIALDEDDIKEIGGGKVNRRQKRRLKKMNQEYADQDEEERKIGMVLHASAERTKGKERKVQSEAVTTSKESKSVGGNEDAPKRCYKCEKVGHLAKDCQEQHLDEAVQGGTNGRLKDNDTLNEAKRIALEEDDIKEISGGKVGRRQNRRLKKMNQEYADQDKEERKIRMALLASVETTKGKEQEVQSEAVTTSKESKSVGDAPKRCYKCEKVVHLAKDCQEQHLDEAVQGGANGGHEDNNTLNEAERIALEEDDIKEIGDDEKEKLKDVDYLTGIPLPNDILLYAIPVCAPYAAVQSYKYCVEIIPGTAKKGKAAKMAMNLFGHMPEATQREKELMNACTDPELVAAFIGNVEVSAAGFNQLKQKQKKGKKSSL